MSDDVRRVLDEAIDRILEEAVAVSLRASNQAAAIFNENFT
jgi:hypothetical protein